MALVPVASRSDAASSLTKLRFRLKKLQEWRKPQAISEDPASANEPAVIGVAIVQ